MQGATLGSVRLTSSPPHPILNPCHRRTLGVRNLRETGMIVPAPPRAHT